MRDFNFSEFALKKERDRIFWLNKNKSKCVYCDLFNCICQLSLSPDWVEVVIPIKDPVFAVRVANCPHNCLNAQKDCLECYGFDKFKGVIVL